MPAIPHHPWFSAHPLKRLTACALFAAAGVLTASTAWAADPAALPPEFRQSLERAGVPVSAVSVLVKPLAEPGASIAPAPRLSWRAGPLQVLALLDARMDEVYAARYAWDGAVWSRARTWTVGKPETLHLPAPGESVDPPPNALDEATWVLAGNAFDEYGSRLLTSRPELRRVPALPTAEAMLRLAPALLAAGEAVAAEHAMPRYIRDKVAQTTAERAALKASQP